MIKRITIVLLLIAVSCCLCVEKDVNTYTPENESVTPTYETPIVEPTPPTLTQTPMPVIPTDICSKIWRYDLECALHHALNKSELNKIRDLALSLKGDTIQRSVWNILEWEDRNIEYDWMKASLPPPKIVYTKDYKGNIINVRIISGKENTYQTPSETIQRGRGVCKDYAILTAGLLLAMGYSPVYIFSIDFEENIHGHVVAGVKIDGQYFLMDQHPPVMDLGTYYKHWKYYNNATKGTIKRARVYEVRIDDREVEVRVVGNITGDDFKRYDHTIRNVDLLNIRNDLSKILEQNFPHLIEDDNIAHLDEQRYLPKGYSEGKVWTLTLPNFADYYNPVFHNEFVRYIYRKIVTDRKIVEDLRSYRYYWLRVDVDDKNLKVVTCLAR